MHTETGMAPSKALMRREAEIRPIGAPTQSRLRRFMRRHKLNSGLLFVLPALLLYLLFVAWPIVSIFWLSFYNWDGISARTRRYIGWSNYVELLTDDRAFRVSIQNNVLWAVLTIGVLVVVSFLLAYLLNQPLRLRNLYRSVLFLPTTASLIVVGATWLFIYNPQIGLLNQTLRTLGLEHLTRVWMNDPRLTIYAVIVVAIWHALGIWVVVYLAALQSISQDLYDSAAIDGATGFAKMIYIAVPLTLPTTRALVILGLIGAVNQFGLVYTLSRGGPYHASEVMAYQVYQLAFQTNRTGYASALSVVLLLIAAVITAIQLRLYRRRDEHGTRDQ